MKAWYAVFKFAAGFVRFVAHAADVCAVALVRVDARAVAVILRPQTDTSVTVAEFGGGALADYDPPDAPVVAQLSTAALAAVLKLVRTHEDLEISMDEGDDDVMHVCAGGRVRQVRFALRLQQQTTMVRGVPVVRLPSVSDGLPGPMLHRLLRDTLAACPDGETVAVVVEGDGRVAVRAADVAAGVSVKASHRPSWWRAAAAPSCAVAVLASTLRTLGPVLSQIKMARVSCGGSHLPLRVQGQLQGGASLVVVIAPCVPDGDV